jgi:hypothetical protein
MAIMMLVMCYGLLYHNMWVVGVAVAAIFFGTYGWALEGVGGHHMKAGGHGHGHGEKHA